MIGAVVPELPEVETTRRGLEPLLLGRRIDRVIVRQRRLRYPIPASLPDKLGGRRVRALRRRGKYLLLDVDDGALLLHLGMSGSLRFLRRARPASAHDHLDVVVDGGTLRLRDPRRFGAALWVGANGDHPLLADLGPEPLGEEFDGGYLHRVSRRRRVAIKSLIMDSRVVVGVGNIYAAEALFAAGVHPARAAGRLTRPRCERLARAIREVLAAAIERGGTTLRDFVDGDGRPGYFAQRLRVYGRAGSPCRRCRRPLRELRVAQRASVFCPRCQR